MKLGIVIPIYNRPEYVRRCFDSLRTAKYPKNTLFVLVDDNSSDPEIKELIASFEIKNCSKLVRVNKTNQGVKFSLLFGIEDAFLKGCDVVMNLDSDAVVKPDFVQKITGLHGKSDCIVSGFNCHSEKNEPIIETGVYATKLFCNGINMCFNLRQYDRYIKQNLQAEGNWDYNTSKCCALDTRPFKITTPSVVQHIGMKSSMGHNHQLPDYAQDFKLIHLPDVTLFGIDSHNIAGIQRAADISQRDIDFGAVKIITDDLFTKGGNSDTRRRDYSRFMLKELNSHFDTSHVLTIHADGYVLNWEAWDNSWLQYDYIGATWSYKDNMNVGNGGFSLRSKKLCDILAKVNFEQYHPEDHIICRVYREDLEKRFGIKFAPEEVANQFSIEGYGAHIFPEGNVYSGQFGFHSEHVDMSTAEHYNIPKQLLYTKPAKQQQVYKPQMRQW